jgi:capsular polysaccharide biosynthesis protein
VTTSGTKDAITPRLVGEVLWRQKLVCALTALIILIIGSTVVLTRPLAYQSRSSIALLPSPKNPGILSNYPNLIISLVPTYVQLVSSPVLLNKVVARVPFHITETQLAADLHAESVSNAAIINIVAQGPSPMQARQIASAATSSFLAQVRGNGVVIPRIYGLPTASPPTPPSTPLLLAVVLVLAVILGSAAGLIWDRWAGLARRSGLARWSAKITEATRRSLVPNHPAEPDRASAPSERAKTMASGAVRPIESFDTVKLRAPSREEGNPTAPGETSNPTSPGNGKPGELP